MTDSAVEVEHLSDTVGRLRTEPIQVPGLRGSFTPNVTYIPERVKDLRCSQPTLCWRPSSDWKNVCIRYIGHSGRCGWERPCDCLVCYRHGSPVPWTCPECGQRWVVQDSRFVHALDEWEV